MIVYKFGGGTVKDAESIKQLRKIVSNCKSNLVIVISALNKVTNQFEKLTEQYYSNSGDCFVTLNSIKKFHLEILQDLFPDINLPVYKDINKQFSKIETILRSSPKENFDQIYDQLVPYGEILSTKIISSYLNMSGINNSWLDARELIVTDDNYREARPDWTLCNTNINRAIDFKTGDVFICQGFIGATSDKHNTTLGREGSDFSAALIAYVLDADKVIIWKDVDGILNADPVDFPSTVLINKISYHEAIEMAFYGAKVIHPRTIKPLENKNIPLYVKSFYYPEQDGTIICDSENIELMPPVYILKKDQVLISILPRDFSFIVEDNLGKIFTLLAKYRIKVNLTQNSAISFSVCVNNNRRKIRLFMDEIKDEFRVLYNDKLTLITIRHYTKETLKKQTKDKRIFIQQQSRKTARFVVA